MLAESIRGSRQVAIVEGYAVQYLTRPQLFKDPT